MLMTAKEKIFARAAEIDKIKKKYMEVTADGEYGSPSPPPVVEKPITVSLPKQGSNYLTGGTVYQGTPYGAAQSNGAATSVLAAQKPKAEVDLTRVVTRAEELAGLDRDLTDREKAEATALSKALKGGPMHGLSVAASVLTDRNKYQEESKRQELAKALEVRIAGPVQAGFAGAAASIPFAGRAYDRLVELGDPLKDIRTSAGITMAADYLPDQYNGMKEMKEEHPTAFSIGKGAGTVAQMLAAGGAVQKGLAGIEGFRSLPNAAQAAISSGVTMGGTNAIQTASGGGSAGEAAKAGIMGLAGGAAGGAAGSLVGATLDKVLLATPLRDNIFANMVADGLSASAFTGADMTARAVLDKDYDPTAEEAKQAIGVSFAFAAFSSLMGSHMKTREAKARLDADTGAARADLEYILANAGKPGYTYDEALEDLAARSAGIRKTINSTQYIGHHKEVRDALAFLDWLDDGIAAVRGSAGRGQLIAADPALPALVDSKVGAGYNHDINPILKD